MTWRSCCDAWRYKWLSINRCSLCTDIDSAPVKVDFPLLKGDSNLVNYIPQKKSKTLKLHTSSCCKRQLCQHKCLNWLHHAVLGLHDMNKLHLLVAWPLCLSLILPCGGCLCLMYCWSRTLCSVTLFLICHTDRFSWKLLAGASLPYSSLLISGCCD